MYASFFYSIQIFMSSLKCNNLLRKKNGPVCIQLYTLTSFPMAKYFWSVEIVLQWKNINRERKKYLQERGECLEGRRRFAERTSRRSFWADPNGPDERERKIN